MEGNWGFSSVKSGKNFMVLILLGEKAEIHLTLEQKKTLQRTIIYMIGRHRGWGAQQWWEEQDLFTKL